MKKIFGLLLLLIWCLTAPALAQILPSTALEEAERFVSILDNQKYHQVYQQTSRLFKLLTTEQDWSEEPRISFEVLEQAVDRQLTAARARDLYPGPPDGHYLIVSFETRTTCNAKAIEVFLLVEENQSWQICKYSIR